MISKSVYEWDVRVRREAEALAAAGHQLIVVGLGADHPAGAGIRVVGVGQSPSSGRRQDERAWWYQTGRWLLLPDYRQRAINRFQRSVRDAVNRLDFQPDVIHAHDFPALEPAIELSDRFGARLVYDSHEYWAGLPRRGRPEPLRRASNQSRERDLARRADLVIMVSPMGADLMVDRLGLERVEVIRNTFPTRPNPNPPLLPKGAVYSGRIAPGRDLETVLAATAWSNDGLDLHLIGELDEIDIPGFAHIHPMGTMDDVDELLVSTGIGLVTMSDGPINHRIALPNKLFQSISAGIPVVASDLPQTAAVVTDARLGTLYTPGDTASFDRAVKTLADDYPSFVSAVAAAQHRFDWSVDAARLVEMYDGLQAGRSPYEGA